MKTAAEILTEAKVLIDTPEKWCQEKPRIGARRCLWSALIDAAPRCADTDLTFYLEQHVEPYLKKAFRSMGLSDFVTVANDTATHAQVMQAFSIAIAAAKEGAA